MKGKGNSFFRKLTNILLDILIFVFVIILAITLYKAVQVKLFGNSYASFFGYSFFEVKTGSMADTINISDMIIVKSKDEIKLNDIITYEKDGNFITHRVIEKYKGTYITKGDANNAKDDPVSQEQIVGVVQKIIPKFGIYKRTILNPIVLLFLIITLYIFSFTFRKNNKEEKKSGLSMKIDMIFEKLADKVLNSLDDKEKYKQMKERKESEIKKKEDNKEKKSLEEVMASLDDEENEVEEQTIETEEETKETSEETADEAVNDEDNENTSEVNFEQVAGTTLEEEVAARFGNVPEMSEEDLDKTIFYRAVKVDVSELDDTFSEITKNQAAIDEEDRKIAEKLEEKKRIAEEKARAAAEADEEIEESLIQNSLEMLQKKDKRKFSNIIDRIMYLKEKELDEILEILNDGRKLLTNEASIKNSMILSYIDGRYYNFCGNANAEYTSKNMTSKLNALFVQTAADMTKAYKGSDSNYGSKANKYANIFTTILTIEQIFDSSLSNSALRDLYVKKLAKYFKESNLVEKREVEIIDNIIKTQRMYNAMIKYTINKLNTDVFELEYNQLSSNKKMYGLDLKHKIAFSKVYSDYIVDKTYSEGIIAEDKVIVLISLLSSKIVKDMLVSDFSSKYLLYLPDTIYEKDNKLGQFIKVTSNEYLKNNLYILVNYKTLINNKKTIKDLKKAGYKFALVFTETVKVEAKNQAILNVVDYVYIDKKHVDAASIVSTLPEDVKKNVVNEEVGSKVGNYGGE